MFRRQYLSVVLLVIAFSSQTRGEDQPKPKRQIFREQVLPLSGGKIPDGAFTSDRLALNKLNKAGIAIPDGVLLEQRQVFTHPHQVRHDPEDEADLVRIVQQPEDRYVPHEGAYHNERPLTIPSTYIIRKPTHATDIRTPAEQMPYSHSHLLASKPGGSDDITYSDYGYPGTVWKPFRFEDSVHPTGYPNEGVPPATYHGHSSVFYYPKTIPLKIPNNHLKHSPYPDPSQSSDGEDIHSIVDWPYLLKEYTRLAEEINAIHRPNRRPYHQTIHSNYLTPKVITSIPSFYNSIGRYARTSKEVSLTTHGRSNLSKVTSKDGRTVIKLRCNLPPGKSIDALDAKCRLRH